MLRHLQPLFFLPPRTKMSFSSFLKESRAQFDKVSEKGRNYYHKDTHSISDFDPRKKNHAPPLPASESIHARPLAALKDPNSFPAPPVHRVAHGSPPVPSRPNFDASVNNPYPAYQEYQGQSLAAPGQLMFSANTPATFQHSGYPQQQFPPPPPSPNTFAKYGTNPHNRYQPNASQQSNVGSFPPPPPLPNSPRPVLSGNSQPSNPQPFASSSSSSGGYYTDNTSYTSPPLPQRPAQLTGSGLNASLSTSMTPQPQGPPPMPGFNSTEVPYDDAPPPYSLEAGANEQTANPSSTGAANKFTR